MPAVTLLRPHTHAGVAHPAGKTLHVDASTAAWLAAQGVAEAAHHRTLKSAAPAAGEPAAAPARQPTAPRIAETDTTGDDHAH